MGVQGPAVEGLCLEVSRGPVEQGLAGAPLLTQASQDSEATKMWQLKSMF